MMVLLLQKFGAYKYRDVVLGTSRVRLCQILQPDNEKWDAANDDFLYIVYSFSFSRVMIH